MKIVPLPASSRQVANCSITPRLVKFESAYSILSRFASANVISGAAVARLFRNRCEQFRASRTNNLCSLYSVSIGSLEHELNLKKEEVYDLFLTPNYLADHWSLCSLLRFCPVCMSQGVHYAIFQFDKLISCPAHKVPLEAVCRFCGAATPFRLVAETFRTPFGCAQCRRSLMSGDYRNSSSSLQDISGLPLEAERIYKALEAVVGRRLSMPLLHASRVRSSKAISAMRLESNCGAEEDQFFSHVVSARTIVTCDSIRQFAFSSRLCQRDLPHHLEIGGREFGVLIDELVAVLKALIRHMCFASRVPTKTVALVSENNLLESTVQGLTDKVEELEVLVLWRKLWFVHSTFSGRAAIGYAVSSWLGRFCRENSTIALTTKERSWLAKHVFADEMLNALAEFRRHRRLDVVHSISDDATYAAPCWAVEVDEDDLEIRRISYTRQATV